MCCGYGDGSAALYAMMDASHERCTNHEFDKEHVKYIVDRIPNRDEPVSPVGTVGKQFGRTGSMRRFESC
jgi:hypothetical protein